LVKENIKLSRGNYLFLTEKHFLMVPESLTAPLFIKHNKTGEPWEFSLKIEFETHKKTTKKLP
jgi:hypothetical protein